MSMAHQKTPKGCYDRFIFRPIALIILVVALITPSAAAAPALIVTPFISELDDPVSIVHAGDQSGRLFIIQRNGKIAIYDGKQILSIPYLDVSSLITQGFEQGLLDAAFHPDYATNGFFYISYTDLRGDAVIARYSVSSTPDKADPNSSLILLTISQPDTNHNGGQLQFGPDGYLYIGMGDGGSSGDPQNNAQNLQTLLGKILRIDVDAETPYAIPTDNPYVANPDARGEIWAFGLRNPWRFSFDQHSGDLFIADVGQDKREEVNFASGNSKGGENYGWRLMEGSQCFNPSQNCFNDTLSLPILEYDHSQGCSITGGYVYRGSDSPDLTGIYIYGDFCSGTIWGATQNAEGQWSALELLDTDLRITSFGEDEEGELYIASFTPAPGAIFRISQASEDGSDSDNGGTGSGCLINSLKALFIENH